MASSELSLILPSTSNNKKDHQEKGAKKGDHQQIDPFSSFVKSEIDFNLMVSKSSFND